MHSILYLVNKFFYIQNSR